MKSKKLFITSFVVGSVIAAGCGIMKKEDSKDGESSPPVDATKVQGVWMIEKQSATVGDTTASQTREQMKTDRLFRFSENGFAELDLWQSSTTSTKYISASCKAFRKISREGDNLNVQKLGLGVSCPDKKLRAISMNEKSLVLTEVQQIKDQSINVTLELSKMDDAALSEKFKSFAKDSYIFGVPKTFAEWDSRTEEEKAKMDEPVYEFEKAKLTFVQAFKIGGTDADSIKLNYYGGGKDDILIANGKISAIDTKAAAPDNFCVITTFFLKDESSYNATTATEVIAKGASAVIDFAPNRRNSTNPFTSKSERSLVINSVTDKNIYLTCFGKKATEAASAQQLSDLLNPLIKAE